MKAYYDREFKIITYSSDNDVVKDPIIVGSVSMDNSTWFELCSKSDEVYLDKDFPEDFSKITTKTPVVDLPAEMIEAIEFAEKQAKKNEALEYLARYQALQLAPSLGNNELLTLAPLYPDWCENTPYVEGDPINYNGVLFKVKQSHTSQIDWLPENTPALYVKVTPEGMILEFGKNPDGTDRDLTNNPYTIGERCTWQGKLYESIFEGNNIWSPADYPAGWKEV